MAFYIRVQHLNDQGISDFAHSLFADEESALKLINYINENRKACELVRVTPRAFGSIINKMSKKELKQDQNKKLIKELEKEVKKQKRITEKLEKSKREKEANAKLVEQLKEEVDKQKNIKEDLYKDKEYTKKQFKEVLKKEDQN